MNEVEKFDTGLGIVAGAAILAGYIGGAIIVAAVIISAVLGQNTVHYPSDSGWLGYFGGWQIIENVGRVPGNHGGVHPTP